MSKQIEPGCRARLVNCRNQDNEGKIVTVGKFLGDITVNGNLYKRVFEINAKLVNTYGEITNISPEFHLKRIDDYDGNEAGSWEEIKDIWRPTEITINQ